MLKDMPNPHASAPFFEALQRYTRLHKIPFHMPGHTGTCADQAFINQLGADLLALDLTELDEVDNLHDATHALKDAMNLAADAFGAAQSFFLVNGSTCGNQAMILAACRPGDKILVPRNAHKSVINGLIMAGVTPVYLWPEQYQQQGLTTNICPQKVRQALQTHPDIRAVLVVSPTYYGIAADLEQLAEICHGHQVPLLVDEAHGAHCHFHPDLPLSAMAAGADMAVQSTHKTLSGLTQTAMLHVNSAYIDLQRVKQVLQWVQSSSPSAILLASLDTARRQIMLKGNILLSRLLGHARWLRATLEAAGLSCILPTDAGSPGFFALDETKLTLRCSDQTSMTGFEVEEHLNNTFDIQVELVGLDHIMLMLTLGTTREHVQRLAVALIDILGNVRDSTALNATVTPPPGAPLSLPPLSPRDAFYAPTETLPVSQVAGRLSAETLSPYPPGIPVLMAGERITTEILHFLQTFQQAGGLINGLTDPDLQTLRVIVEPSR